MSPENTVGVARIGASTLTTGSVRPSSGESGYENHANYNAAKTRPRYLSHSRIGCDGGVPLGMHLHGGRLNVKRESRPLRPHVRLDGVHAECHRESSGSLNRLLVAAAQLCFGNKYVIKEPGDVEIGFVVPCFHDGLP